MNFFFHPRIRVSGKRPPKVEIVKTSILSLASDAVFILDAGQTIYVYNGPKASRVTKAKAADVSNQIRMKERAGLAKVKIVDELPEMDQVEFWKVLGKNKQAIDKLLGEEIPPLMIHLYQ